MKPHLPLPVRRALMKSLSGGARRTLCSGSLVLAGVLLWSAGPAGAAEATDNDAAAVPLACDEAADETAAAADEEEEDEEEGDAERRKKKKRADEYTTTLDFTTRFLYGMQELLAVIRTEDAKGAEIKIWSPVEKQQPAIRRRLHIYMPSTSFMYRTGGYEAYYNAAHTPAPATTTPPPANKAGATPDITDYRREPGKDSRTKRAATVALTKESQDTTEETEQPGSSDSYTSSGSDNPSKKFAEETLGRMRSMRSSMRMTSAARSMAAPLSLGAEEESAVQTPAPLASDNTLVWTGKSNGYWDAAAPNWTPYNGSGEAVTFPVSGGSALFDLSGQNKDINVTTEQNLADMEISAGGYSFSGGGNINIEGGLVIAARGALWGAVGENLLVTFGQANNITAGSIRLGSGFDTVTTFGGAVTTTGTLSIANGSGNNKGGSYVFNNGLTVGGAASITLGSDEGAMAKELLKVTGDFSAASLFLDGTARKTFNNAVSITNGDLTISGHEGTADTLTDGITTFKGAVTIAEGHKLLLEHNTEATFNSTLESAGGPGTLQIELNRGILRVNTYLSSMSSGVAYDLGTITLTGQGGITFGARTVAQADIIGNGQKLIIGGSAAHADLYLTHDGNAATSGISGDITISGGKVHLFAEADSEGRLKGQLGGRLTAGNHSSVTLKTNDLFATTANGLLVEDGATLSLGNTTQTVYGGITMKNGGIITGEAGSSLKVPGSVTSATFHYEGTNNQLGSTIVQGEGNTLTFTSDKTGSELALTGDITGASTLAFSGAGRSTINTALSYTGNVEIRNGATLVINDTLGLAQVNKLTVGSASTLDVTHGGTTNFIGREGAGTWNEDVQMKVGLELASGAILTFTDLSGHGDTPALALEGGLLFNGSITFNFLESDSERKLENLKTYELITSATGINHIPGSSGGVSVIANGKTTPLDESQYSFAYYRDDKELRHLTFTLLVGKNWKGGASGSWHAKDANDDYANWTEGAVGDTALFRQQEVSDVTITFDQQSRAAGLYMDGTTNYSINDTLGADTRAFEPVEGETYFIKKGSGSMTWNSLSTTMSDVDIHQGSFALTGGSKVTVNSAVTIADATYDDAGNMAATALLTVDSSSALRQGTASLSGSSAGAAELRALTISGGVIAANSSGTTGAATPSIKNAAISGYELEGIELQGTGSINGGTLGEGTTIAAGSTQTFSGEISLDATITNNGTVKPDSNVVFDIGALASSIGEVSTYTLFSGGSYTNWNSNTLEASNFRLNGVQLSLVGESKGNKGQVTTSVTENGKVTLSSENVVFVNWDPAWVHDEYTTIPIIAFDFVKHKNKAFATIANNKGAWSSLYANRMAKDSTVGENIFVAHLADGTGSRESGAHGDITGKAASNNFAYAWLNTEASLFHGYAAGSDGGSTFYGNSYLQVTGDLANANYIVGATYNGSQYGNSYLTITAGDYTDAGLNGSQPIVAAGNYNLSKSETDTAHYGDSFLHLSGGKFGTVHGGSYETYTKAASFTVTDNGQSITKTPTGLTHVLIDGTAVVDTIYGGDFTTSDTKHTGDVLIDIKGGTVKNVYAAGSPDGSNKNKLDGSATVNIYATDGELDASHFAAGGILYGGVPSLASPRTLENPDGDTSELHFKTADSRYDLRPLNIQWFNVYNLADGAHVIVATNGFNTTNALEVMGAGTVEVVGDNSQKNTTPHDITLMNGATLWLNTSHYQSTAVSTTPSVIKAEEGTAVNATYTHADEDQNALNIHLMLEGTGTDGEGALYKNVGAALAEGTSFPQITLTGDALVTLKTGTSLHMVSHRLIDATSNEALYEQTTLDLRNGAAGTEGYNARGYELTLNGGGALGLYNTDIVGGTLNVRNGIIQSNMSSNAGDSDLLLHAGARLELTNTDDGTGFFGDEPGTDTPAAFNGLSIESLSGGGSIDLGNKGWLYINMDKGHAAFAEGVDASGIEGYAHFSGSIEAGGGKVTKAGEGYQSFSGSNSLYSGGTSFMGGRLYALAGSNAAVFIKEQNATVGVTEVNAALGGVFGTGDLTWEGGALYMANGVNIYNNGAAVAGADIIFGVESHEAQGGAVSYDVATYSGVLSGGGTAEGHTSTLVKEGGGTLILAQDGSFTGPVQVKEGSLNLRRWVDANDYSSITVDSGATLLLSYDNTGLSPEGKVNEITKADSPITISGTGDPRWLTLGTRTRTAALSSGIGTGKEQELAGVIQDGTAIGNVLHSGEGTLILSGANTYSGGTAVDGGELYNYGTVIVAHNTALGSTAEGRHANLVTEEASNIIFAKGVKTTLAAVKEGEYAGNDIRGRVTLRSNATLCMMGNGYYATRTELESGATLVFRGKDAANWDGTANKEKPEESTDMVGAGTLAGSAGSTVAVSDAAGAGTKVYFQVTDSMPTSDSATAPTNGYAGDLVVEGDKALLHVEGGQLEGGNYSVSGYGARLDAKRSLINVENGKQIALRSLGDEDSNPESTACLAAYRVEVEAGGTLSAARAETEFQYKELGLEEAMNTEDTSNLTSYMASSQRHYAFIDPYTAADGYEHYFDHNNAINQYTAATLDTVGGLTMLSGAVYQVNGTNTGLEGTQLTLDVSGDDGRILLRGGTAFQNYIDTLAKAGMDADIETEQWVLFSDVGTFTAISKVANLTCTMQEDSLVNQIYVARANEFVVAEDTDGDGENEELADNILLVYDAGARVLYLDRKPNTYTDPVVAVPEPGTTTLSLLALTALMARRRRK